MCMRCRICATHSRIWIWNFSDTIAFLAWCDGRRLQKHCLAIFNDGSDIKPDNCLITVWDLRKSLDWRFIWPLLIVFLPTSTFFSYVMFGTDASWLKIILGITLILLSIYFTFFKKDGIKIKPNWFNTISLGSLSGLMGGLFSMQGPPVVYYYLSTQKTKEEYMAQTQCFFLLGNLWMTILRAGEGIITAEVGKSYLIAIAGCLAGMWIGARVYNKMNNGLLLKVIYIFLAYSGVSMIIGQ